MPGRHRKRSSSLIPIARSGWGPPSPGRSRLPTSSPCPTTRPSSSGWTGSASGWAPAAPPLDRLGQRLAAVCDRQDLTYHFALLEWDEINAFALPGGYIYVSTELLTLAKSDDELASVLGHEIGHVVAKHAVKRLQAALGAAFLQALTTVGSRDPRLIQGAQIAINQLFLAPSRQDELQADTLSVRYLTRADFNPEAALAFMERMQERIRKEPIRPFSYRSEE